MKVLSVVGTRPEFVMAFPVSRRLRRDHEEVLVHTGQHYDAALTDVFVSELDLADPEYELDGAASDSSLCWPEVVSDLRTVVDREDPDAVLVYGDTDSTLCGAVAAAGTATLVHVEAGVRSGNDAMAEERNRVLVDTLATIRFVPTVAATRNLRSEGLDDDAYLVGDLLADAVTLTRNVARRRSTVLSDLGVDPGTFVLATVHRAENVDDRERLGAIVEGLASSPLPVVLPAHPRTVERLREFGLYAVADEALDLVDPLGYLDFIRLLDAADRVATDSGGVQKEATYLDTHAITLREHTEWPETVERGENVLVGADTVAIRDELRREPDPQSRKAAGQESAVADRIVAVLDACIAGGVERAMIPERE